MPETKNVISGLSGDSFILPLENIRDDNDYRKLRGILGLAQFDDEHLKALLIKVIDKWVVESVISDVLLIILGLTPIKFDSARNNKARRAERRKFIVDKSKYLEIECPDLHNTYMGDKTGWDNNKDAFRQGGSPLARGIGRLRDTKEREYMFILGDLICTHESDNNFYNVDEYLDKETAILRNPSCIDDAQTPGALSKLDGSDRTPPLVESEAVSPTPFPRPRLETDNQPEPLPPSVFHYETNELSDVVTQSSDSIASTTDALGDKLPTAPPNNWFSDYIDHEVKALGQALQEEHLDNPFSYRSQVVSFVGREEELELLKKFLSDEQNISLISITGSGGSGKSRLIYQFVREHTSSADWAFVHLDWSHFNANVLNQAPLEYGYNKHLVLILDYVLADAKEIGQWIRTIENHHAPDFQKKLRIIVLEREVYSPDLDRPPFWYDQMIVSNKLQRSSVLYREHITLTKLEDKHLIEIAKKYIHSKTGESVSTETIDREIISPLKDNLDQEHCRPIFLLYIADAWIKEKGNIRQWDRQELLAWIDNNEVQRLKNLVGNDEEIYTRLANLLSYAIAVKELKHDNLPQFLQDDWGALTKRAGISLKRLFDAMNINKHDSLILEAMTPDLLGEYYCLNHLKKSKLDNGDEDFLKAFIDDAWSQNPQEFFSFMDRIVDDYPEHSVTKKLIERPQFIGDEGIYFYANLLFSLTYRNSMGRSIWALEQLEILYLEYPRIVLEYAKALVNISAAYSEVSDKKTALDKLCVLSQRYSGSAEIALPYAMALFSISNAYSEISDKKNALDKLCGLSEEHSDSTEIVLEYAKALVNIANAYSKISDKATALDKLRVLSDKPNSSAEIGLYYAMALFNISNAYSKISDKKAVVETLRVLSEEHSDSTEIALEYANALFNISNAYSKIPGKEEVLDKLRILSKKYNSSTEIGLCYTKALVNISFDYSEISDKKAALDELRVLSKKYNGSTEIGLYYAKALFSISLDYSEISDKKNALDELRVLSDKPSSSTEIVLRYARALFNISFDYSEISDKEEALKKLHALSNKYGGYAEIALEYAKSLVNISFDYSEISDKKNALDELCGLSEKYSGSTEMGLYYARALYNISNAYPGISDKDKVLKKLHALSNKYGGYAEIALEYAKALVNISVAYPEISDKKNALDKLCGLSEEYGDSTEIALEYAKALFNITLGYSEIPDEGNSLEKLRVLYGRHSNSTEIVLMYATALAGVFSVYSEISDKEEALEELRVLSDKYNSSPETVFLYADALVNIINDYSKIPDKDKAKKALEKLATLADTHKNSIEIMQMYEYGCYVISLAFPEIPDKE